MDIIILEQQWNKINKNSEHKSIRVSNDCKSDLYLGIDNNSKRRLILSLPEQEKLNINDDIKEYISIQYFDLSNHLIITLIEDRFKEVFNAFIVSVFFKVKDIAQPLQVVSEITKTYFEWSEFFIEKINSELTLTDLMGIVGELFTLNKEIAKANAISINDVLKGWAGPYGKGHDFIFEESDIEVKAIEISKTDVRISSEFQLELSAAKPLVLKVLKIEINGSDGTSLSVFIETVRNSIIERIGDLSIFLKGLQKHGVSIHNMEDYENYNFKIKEEISYDCSKVGFPKLIRSNIPIEISSLSYQLKTTLLDKFIIEKISY